MGVEPIRDLSVYEHEWNDCFDLGTDFDDGARGEGDFRQWEEIHALVGGMPKHVQDVKVSNTTVTSRRDFSSSPWWISASLN